MDSLARQALEANETHKNALDAYTSKLQAELLAVDKLIAAVEEIPEDENQEDPSDRWCLQVENAFKPSGIIDLAQARNEVSPLYPETIRKDRYLMAITPNPFSKSEMRYLEKAIIKENKRLVASHAKESGLDPFQAVATGDDFFLDNTDDINWESVACDVSASNSPLGARSAQDCKVRWLGAQNRKINNGKWSESEEEHLRELVQSKPEGSRIDWQDVSRGLATNRTALECMRIYLAGNRQTFKWNGALDKKLMEAVRDHGNSNWGLVATLVSPDVSANQCQIRYGRSINPDIKKGKFSPEEDQLLRLAVETHGCDWVKVAEALPGRTNAQCRDRYSNHSGRTTNSAWTDEEDTMLKNAVLKLGRNWEQVREEMGSFRTRAQYTRRYGLLARKDAQEANTPGGETSDSIPGGPNNEVEQVEVEQVDMSNLIGASEEPIQSTRGKLAMAGQKTKAPKGKGVRRTFTTKATDLPQNTEDTPLHDDPVTSIPKKRPRPRPLPRIRGVTKGGSIEPSADAAPIPVLELRPNGNKSSDISHPVPTSQSAAQPIASTRMSSRQILESVAASLAGELSDLTDLEDLEDLQDAPPPKKKARGSAQSLNPVAPSRTRKPRTSAQKSKPSPQKLKKPSSSPYTPRTRSSARNVAQGQ